MYAIYQHADGTFYCGGGLQDGTERWTRSTLEEAVKSLKDFAKSLNGTKIKRKDIGFFRQVQVVKAEWTRCELP